jgi:hypothetical protein
VMLKSFILGLKAAYLLLFLFNAFLLSFVQVIDGFVLPY